MNLEAFGGPQDFHGHFGPPIIFVCLALPRTLVEEDNLWVLPVQIDSHPRQVSFWEDIQESPHEK